MKYFQGNLFAPPGDYKVSHMNKQPKTYNSIQFSGNVKKMGKKQIFFIRSDYGFCVDVLTGIMYIQASISHISLSQPLRVSSYF